MVIGWIADKEDKRNKVEKSGEEQTSGSGRSYFGRYHTITHSQVKRPKTYRDSTLCPHQCPRILILTAKSAKRSSISP